MISSIILTSLQIIFIHVLFFDGMILGKLRLWYLKRIERANGFLLFSKGIYNLDDRTHFLSGETKNRMLITKIGAWIIANVFSFLKKPLFDCLICMTSVWGTIIYLVEFQHRGIAFIPFLFCVGGILALASAVISVTEDKNGEKFVDSKPLTTTKW